jgi:hypothetical protein
MPEAPRGLVLGVSRHAIPHAEEAPWERAEITADGACERGVPSCAHVPPARLATLAALLREASRVAHDPAMSSPHYGYRSVYARWEGGECEVIDSWRSPVSRGDMPAFDAAWDAFAREGKP